ncbi:hypothetical protein C8R44DRAFT_773541 [Mycena epipterygia]|nr:hypothetical protein C8R44DRAFT_773541 [Mycena epipterygia]
MSARLESSQLLRLPNELLLIILDFLREATRGERGNWFYSTRHVHSLSLVNQRLRQLCLPLLFSSLKLRDTQQLQLLNTKCTEDVRFATLIKKLDLLDLFDEELPDFLRLLGRLKSLEWLDLVGDQVDASLLATVNSHPNLTTFAVCDPHLRALKSFSTSTSASLSLSKILINSAVLTCTSTLQSPALYSLMNRNPRVAHLVLSDSMHIKAGPGNLLFPGLETLVIGVYCEPTFLMSWLPAFAERHTSLKTITFTGDRRGSSWTRNPEILFPLQFIDAVDREALTHTVALSAFSISRAGSTPSLDEWPVTELQITIVKPAGVAGLTIASFLAPQISSLDIRIARHGRRLIRMDDLVSPISRFPSLRRLELHNVYEHLRFDRRALRALPSSAPGRKASKCMDAHTALRWVTARAAQCSSSLDLIHITDQGHEVENGTTHLWRLKATYQVQRNLRYIEFHGRPELIMAKRYDPSPSDLARVWRSGFSI